jgi:glucose/arabinose dehydrogenase
VLEGFTMRPMSEVIEVSRWTITRGNAGLLRALAVASTLVLCGARAEAGETTARASETAASQPSNPLEEWSVADGYSLSVVSRGLDLPTAVVPVPQPGPEPTSPRFFVTELRGKIRTISNDGSLHDFATIETFKPALEWPDYAGEAGLAGLCLEPEHGYVFATYAYRDGDGVLRNGISRFTVQPHTFTGTPQSPESYSEPLSKAPSSFSHQIGSCVVAGGAVYVAVGDGGNPAGARAPEVPVGKVLRLTLDGKPFPENALASASSPAALAYAWGLRNPFGIAMVGDRLYAAENGVELDRLLLVHPARDHGWDGTDASIATNALAIFSPTVGPAHMAHAPASSKALPESKLDRLVIAASNSRQGPGVMVAELDTALGLLTGPPRYIARFEGTNNGQAVTGVAVTPEGIYFTPILPLGATGVLLRTSYDPAHVHAQLIGKKPGNPLTTRGCLGCHSRDGVGGRIGPPLDANSIITRTETKVFDPSYAGWVAKLDAMGDAAIVAGRAGRQEVLQAGREGKVRAWLINRIMNPRFDMPEASMPNLGIGRAEAERIAEDLLGAEPPSKFREAITSKRLMGGVALGVGLSVFCYLVLRVLLVLRRRLGKAQTVPTGASEAR